MLSYVNLPLRSVPSHQRLLCHVKKCWEWEQDWSNNVSGKSVRFLTGVAEVNKRMEVSRETNSSRSNSMLGKQHVRSTAGVSILINQAIFLSPNPQTLSCFRFRGLTSALDTFFLENIISAYLKLHHSIGFACAVATQHLDSGVKIGEGAGDIPFVKANWWKKEQSQQQMPALIGGWRKRGWGTV